MKTEEQIKQEIKEEVAKLAFIQSAPFEMPMKAIMNNCHVLYLQNEELDNIITNKFIDEFLKLGKYTNEGIYKLHADFQKQMKILYNEIVKNEIGEKKIFIEQHFAEVLTECILNETKSSGVENIVKRLVAQYPFMQKEFKEIFEIKFPNFSKTFKEIINNK